MKRLGLVVLPLLALLLAGCGSGGLSSAQVRACNDARAPLQANTAQIAALQSTDATARVDAASKVQDMAQTIASAYQQAPSGAIKTAIQTLGVDLVHATQGVVDAPLAKAKMDGILSDLDALNKACQIKS